MSTAYIQTHTNEATPPFDIFSIAVCEKYTVIGSGAGSVILFDNETTKEQKLHSDISGTRLVCANEKFIVAVFFNGTAKIWNTQTLEPLDLAFPPGAFAVALSSEKNVLAVATIDASITVFNLLDNTELLKSPPQQNQIATCLDISTDGNFLAIGLNSGKVLVIAVDTGNLAYTLPLHTMSPRSVKFSPMGSIVAVAGNVDSISLYSLNGGDLIGTLTGHSSWLFSLSWSETGEFLLSVGHDTLAKVWSIESRTCVTTLNDSTEPLFAGAFFTKGWAPGLIGGQHKGVVTAGSDGVVRWYREAAGA